MEHVEKTHCVERRIAIEDTSQTRRIPLSEHRHYSDSRSRDGTESGDVQKIANVPGTRAKKTDGFFLFLWPRSLRGLVPIGSGSRLQNVHCQNRRFLSQRAPSNIGRSLSCLAHDWRRRYDYYGFEDDGIPDHLSGKREIPPSSTAIATTVSPQAMTTSHRSNDAEKSVATPSATAGFPAQPSGNLGLPHDPVNLSIMTIGALVGIGITLFSIIWLVRRLRKRARPGPSSTAYRRLSRRKIPMTGEDKVIAGGCGWDPESTFAKPSARLRSLSENIRHPATFYKIRCPSPGSRTRVLDMPRIRVKGKPLPRHYTVSQVSYEHSETSCNEIVPRPPRSQLTVDTGPSALLPSSVKSLSPKSGEFPSKFSWTTADEIIYFSSSGHTQHRSNASRGDESEHGTVYTEDSEPPRFRTTSCWVLHQQSKGQHFGSQANQSLQTAGHMGWNPYTFLDSPSAPSRPQTAVIAISETDVHAPLRTRSLDSGGPVSPQSHASGWYRPYSR